MMPTDVMNRPAWQFWMDARIRAAGVEWEADQREQATDGGGAGVATESEKRELAEDQEARADQREAQDGQPSLDAQLAALDDGDGSGGLTDG